MRPTLNLSKMAINQSWAYSNKSKTETAYITHGYYTYPAKFIPQIAHRLISENSDEGDIVVDPFMGSGTTVLEALLTNRIAVGVDINKMAYLLTKVKTTPLKVRKLYKTVQDIENDLYHRMNGFYGFYAARSKKIVPKNSRIDHWFSNAQKKKLSIILKCIDEVEQTNYRQFLLVAFAQILKSTSRWLQSSVKPQIDYTKAAMEPIDLFLHQLNKMMKGNSELVNTIADKKIRLFVKNRIIKCADCRSLPCDKAQADLIVTSPPYITSYEHADLHQLPSLWFEYVNELKDFRKQFIGSAYRHREPKELSSATANRIIKELKGTSKAIEVETYFRDMLESFQEMKRILREGGRACIVIGNSKLLGVTIPNAKILCEQLENINFKISNVIRREISSKMLPTARDRKTGRFAHSNTKRKILIHPEEFIIIAEKNR